MTVPKLEIECPACHHRFALDEMYTSQIEARFKKDFEEKNQDLIKKQKAVSLKEEALQKAQDSIDDEVKVRLQKEKDSLTKEAIKKAKDDFQIELTDKDKELAEKTRKLDEANARELKFREQIRIVEEKEKTIELEIQRRADEKTQKDAIILKQDFDSKFKLAQKEKEIENESLKNKVAELTKKLEQGSQQTQGETLELVLEEELKSLFPLDVIEPVSKGVRGADVIQTVHNNHGKPCGTIIWEFKNTKNWADSWVQKLKDNQHQIKADIAILLTIALPKDIKGFGHFDGVWITDIHSYSSLCTALRMSLTQLHLVRQANLGKNEKMEIIYQYLSGHEFKQRVQVIVDAFKAMKKDLNDEKEAMRRLWAKREKELERVTGGTTGMYGDLEGILGNTIPKIEGLELAALPAPDSEAIAENAESK
jgi:hypothetical protein